MSTSVRIRKRIVSLRRLGGVSLVRVRPGDAIVLSTEAVMSIEQIERLRTMVTRWTGGMRVVVLTSGFQLVGVLRGGQP